MLYPDDNHYEGKSLRLKQQYFFVSASIQRALARFKKHHSDLKDLPNKVVFQMNDTHPTVAVAELMRILLDDYHLEWNEAWDVTTKACAYTNHTIMAEALEKWPIDLFSRLLPRVYQIIQEIDRRFIIQIREMYPGNEEKVKKMAILRDGQVKMAHLAIVAGYSVNGVARLHTEILKNRELKDFYEMMPEYEKMTAVQIPAAVYLDRYDKACRHGYTDVVTVTAGSSFMTTWRAADQARALFYAQHPDAQLRIHVIDSKTYSIAFGAAVLQAAQKAGEGMACADILAFLEDWFRHIEIYITSFSMRYVPANGAFEIMRSIAIAITRAFPIVRVSQGEMEPLEGTYGVQNTFTKFVEYCREAIFATRSPYFITYAKREKEAKEAAETLEAALGYPPEMICQMGASTVYGNGRAAVAVVFQSGKAE